MIGWQLISTADGGFALAGKRKFPDLSRWDVLLLKLSFEGKLQWSKSYFSYFGDQKGKIVQTKNGEFLMTGISADSNLILQRLDQAGNLIWKRALEETFAYPIGLFPIGSGLFVCAIEESGEVVLIKFDGGGTIHLKKKFRSIPGSSLIQAFLISDHGFIVAGYLPNTDNMLLARLDNDWNVVWTKTFMGEILKPFGPLLGRLEVTDIKKTFDGNISVASKIFFPLNVPQTFLLKLSLSGKILDSRWFHSEGDTTPNLVLPLNQGEMLVAGPSFDTPSFGNPSGFLLKLDSNGNLPGCDSVEHLSVREIDAPSLESIRRCDSVSNIHASV